MNDMKNSGDHRTSDGESFDQDEIMRVAPASIALEPGTDLQQLVGLFQEVRRALTEIERVMTTKR